jgi:hypothetical protein
MTYLTDDQSIEDSQPRHLFEFTTPARTYRMTSGIQDIVVGGFTYTAATSEHDEVGVGSTGQQTEVVITMPVTFDLPQRYLRGGVPPQYINVVIYRYQVTSGERDRIWTGKVTSMAIEGHLAKFLVPSRMVEELTRRLPTVSVGRDCPHILYSTPCGVLRDTIPNDFLSIRTVQGINGRIITLDANPDVRAQWRSSASSSTSRPARSSPSRITPTRC